MCISNMICVLANDRNYNTANHHNSHQIENRLYCPFILVLGLLVQFMLLRDLLQITYFPNLPLNLNRFRKLLKCNPIELETGQEGQNHQRSLTSDSSCSPLVIVLVLPHHVEVEIEKYSVKNVRGSNRINENH